MTQTTFAGTFRNARADIAPTATGSWTSLSGHQCAIATDGGDRAIGTQHVFEGDKPIVKGGKRAEMSLSIKFAYTEEAAGPFEICREIYESGTGTYLRYSPFGDSTGSSRFRYQTDLSVMDKFVYPQGEAGPGDIVLGGFGLTTPGVTKSVID